MPADRAEATRAAVMATAGAIAILAIFCCLSAVARPGPQWANAPAETSAWFKNQHNGNGQWCCDESDGHAFYGQYQIHDDGSVTVMAEDGAHTLPAYMVLKGPNPTGHAVWWYTQAGGVHRDYCFAPGTLS